MDVIIKEFVCTTKVQESETIYNFKAVIKCSYDKPYRVICTSTNYRHGSKKSQNQTELYFNKKENMIKEYEYHYNMCKNNLLTNFIKIIK